MGDQLWGIAEIADYFGVSRGLVAKWARETRDFPKPLASLRMGRCWDAAEVKAWGKCHGRHPGDGPRRPD